MGLTSWMIVLTLGLISLQLAESQLCNGVIADAFPHPSDCTKYISCVAGESFVKTCPTGNYFDSKRNACMFPNNDSTCANGVLPAFVASVQPNFCALNHWVDGIHPHPQTCRVYIECINSMPHFVYCSSGQLFDPTDKTCVSAQVARPCNDAPINANLELVCTKSRADVLFILDSSSSMSYQDFALQRRFVISITSKFPVGADNVHFSVMVFSNDAQIKIPFSAQQTNASLASNIDSISYLGSSTFTHTALDLARTFGFSAANGARSDTKKIAIVLTDGLSNNTALTLSAAAQLRQTGVHVIAVGVGLFDRTELDGIATTRDDVFFTDSFLLLQELEREITSKVCNQAVDLFCKNDSYADVIIVMDSSESIGYDNWRKQLDFAASLTVDYKIGPNDMRFAAISYGTVVHKLFDLKSYSLASTIGSAIKLATYQAESTNTAAALRYISDQGMFNLGSGARSDTTKIVIIMTDGQSNNPADTQVEASNLMAQGVHMIAIGIGNAVDFREIIAMSSSDADRFHSTGYEVLFRLEKEVKNRTCHIQDQGPGQDVSNFCLQQNWVNGIHAYPFDCTKFIECTFLHTAIMHCPPNLVYDPILQTCTYPKDAVSCLDHNDYVYLPGQSTPVPHVTAPLDVSLVCQTNHWPNGFYPHPTDCSFYLKCENGYTSSIACPAGSVYDPEWKGCIGPNLAKPCNDFRTTQAPYTTQRYATTTSPRYNLTNICFLYKLPDGLYPDPGSCVHFIECTNQDTKHLICPDGLKFNSKSLYCDDVHLINCNDNYNFQFEHIVVR